MKISLSHLKAKGGREARVETNSNRDQPKVIIQYYLGLATLLV